MERPWFVEMLMLYAVGTPVLRPHCGPWKQPSLPRKRNPALPCVCVRRCQWSCSTPISLPIIQAGLFPSEAKSPIVGCRPCQNLQCGSITPAASGANQPYDVDVNIDGRRQLRRRASARCVLAISTPCRLPGVSQRCLIAPLPTL